MAVSDNKGILYDIRTSKHNCACRVCNGVTNKGENDGKKKLDDADGI